MGNRKRNRRSKSAWIPPFKQNASDDRHKPVAFKRDDYGSWSGVVLSDGDVGVILEALGTQAAKEEASNGCVMSFARHVQASIQEAIDAGVNVIIKSPGKQIDASTATDLELGLPVVKRMKKSVADALSQENIASTKCSAAGVSMAVGMIDSGKTQTAHFMFNFGARRVVDYWPGTGRCVANGSASFVGTLQQAADLAIRCAALHSAQRP